MYVERSGLVVYRASDLGNCIRALVAMGREGQEGVMGKDRKDLLERSADEGDLHEEGVRQKLVREGWKVVSTQQEINLEIIKGVVIRGHTDGILTPPDPELFYRSNVLLEVKSMSNKRFDRWIKGGRLDAYPKFAWQISAYMEANPGLPVLYIAKRREDGLEDRITIPPYNPPVDWKVIRKRILAAENWRRKRAGYPECDLTGTEKYFCPFFYLHDEDMPTTEPTPLSPDEANVLADLIPRRMELKAIEERGKAAEEERKALDKDILNLMGSTKQTQVTVDDVDWKISAVESGGETIDKAKLMADLGEDWPAYVKKYRYSYPKIVEVKPKPKPTPKPI